MCTFMSCYVTLTLYPMSLLLLFLLLTAHNIIFMTTCCYGDVVMQCINGLVVLGMSKNVLNNSSLAIIEQCMLFIILLFLYSTSTITILMMKENMMKVDVFLEKRSNNALISNHLIDNRNKIEQLMPNNWCCFDNVILRIIPLFGALFLLQDEYYRRQSIVISSNTR